MEMFACLHSPEYVLRESRPDCAGMLGPIRQDLPDKVRVLATVPPKSSTSPAEGVRLFRSGICPRLAAIPFRQSIDHELILFISVVFLHM